MSKERREHRELNRLQRKLRRSPPVSEEPQPGTFFGLPMDGVTQDLLYRLIPAIASTIFPKPDSSQGIQVQAFIKHLRQRLTENDEGVQDALVGLCEAFDRFAHVMDLGKPTPELRKVMSQAACALADELDKKSRFEGDGSRSKQKEP